MKLAVQKRDITGKKVKNLRKKSLVPAVIYSKYLSTPIYISVQYVQFVKAYNETGSSTPIILDVEGTEHMVLVHDIQLDIVRDTLQHIDFLAVKADELVEAEVQVLVTGEAPLVKLNLWQLQVIKHTLLVSALPGDLPHDIKVDVSWITNLQDGIFVRDIDLWSKVTILEDADQPVVVAVENAEEESESKSAQESSM